MREVDHRRKYNRRVFLQGAATAVPTGASRQRGLAGLATLGRRRARVDAGGHEDAVKVARESIRTKYLAALMIAEISVIAGVLTLRSCANEA